MKLDDNTIPRAVRTEWFYFIARACMVLATVVGLPIAGAMLSRVINTADMIEAAVNRQAGKLDLLTLRIDLQFAQDKEKFTDHEMRLRQVEIPKK